MSTTAKGYYFVLAIFGILYGIVEFSNRDADCILLSSGKKVSVGNIPRSKSSTDTICVKWGWEAEPFRLFDQYFYSEEECAEKAGIK